MSFYLIFISVNLFIGLFLGLNARVAFSQVICNKPIFWALVFIATQAYWISRVVTRAYRLEIPASLYFVASSLFAICIAAFFIVLGIDIFLFIAWAVKPFNTVYLFIKTHSVHTGIAVIAALLLYYFAGLFIANFPIETHYRIAISKPLAVERVRIVMVSDLHITTFTRIKTVTDLVKRINGLDADLLFFVGDVADGGIGPFRKKGLSGYLSGLRSAHGIYMVMGNHEYYGGDADATAKEFMSAGIRALRDEKVFLEQLGITLIGRDDLSSAAFKGRPRADLAELMDGVDLAKPIIVLDHQPQNRVIKEASASGVDLQLSGHTHNGQFFPFNLIVKKIYTKSWGLFTDGAYHLVVSCGFGTWGPPVRTASYSEIVVAELTGEQ